MFTITCKPARDVTANDRIVTANGTPRNIATVDHFAEAVKVTRTDGWVSWHHPQAEVNVVEPS